LNRGEGKEISVCYQGRSESVIDGSPQCAEHQHRTTQSPETLYSGRCRFIVAVVKLFFSRGAFIVAMANLLFAALDAPSKEIRLRNETIKTGPEFRQNDPELPSQASRTSLILLQFKEPPSDEVRKQLRNAGVELLHAVPEEAFVARARGGTGDWLRSLPSIEWVGAYRPEHKIRFDLAQTRKEPNAQPEVNVLLAPGADAASVGRARMAFHRLLSESSLKPGTILKGRLRRGQLEALLASEAVLWVEPSRPMRLFDEPASKLIAGDAGPNLLLTQSLGYDGAGVKVAVADSGLNNGDAASMHPDLLGRTSAFFHYGLPGQLEDAADEHSHGTHVAGIIAGNAATSEVDEDGALYGLGVAPGATIIAQRIFDGVGNYAPPPSFERLTRDAKRAGADIGSNSWGDDTHGEYDISAMEFDALVRDSDALTPGDQPYILEFSAGNAGPVEGSIGTPAVAKNVIATGASESDRTEFLIYGDGPEVMADFSSRGPCKDGRIKPDVVAPGTYIASLQSQSATDAYAWAPISPHYQYQGGTSQAGPHVSGAAAVFVQYYRQRHGTTPSPALVKAALISSAVDLDDSFGTGPVPNMDEGWGRVNLPTLFDPALDFIYLDQEVALTNMQVFERRVVLGSDPQPLKVILTYTDVPGLPSAAVALVNNLDLEVVSPDGTVYRGNQFQNGASIPNAPFADNINNVEGIMVWTPTPGEYLIRVRGRSVVSDARDDTAAIDQDFALVVSTSFAPAGHGQLILDRNAYTSPDTIRIFLADTDLAGTSSATVTLSSQTEPLGEIVVLQANGNSGAFTGAVATATGAAQNDGKLQISHGNVITARYSDAKPPGTRSFSAVADLAAPTISGVMSLITFGSPEIRWTSSEPANSTVYYGTNLTSVQVAHEAELVSSHAVNLGTVLRDVSYFYYVVSADAAGNRTTNNNSGALYTFRIESGGTILLVDGWPDDPMMLGAPPIAGYTTPLSQLGVNYEIWDTATQGSPAGILLNYPAVIWRLPELTQGWTSAERVAVSNYLHNGGALFVASMEVLSRVQESGDLAFLSNVLQISSFEEDPGVGEAMGETSDPLMSGFEAVLDYQVYEDLWWGIIPADISDTMSPGPDASVLLRDGYGDVVGLRWPALGKEAPGRLVLLTFPLDALGLADRSELIGRLLAFLIPGSSRDAVLTFGASAYQSPGRARIQLADSDLAEAASVTVGLRSSIQPAGVTVVLNRTGRRAEFVGYADIVSTAAAPGQIRAAHGDILTAEYLDPGTGETLVATAKVDTVAPTISGVTAEPDYLEAFIYWETSEPADSLVMFGESAFLERNAYSSSLDSSHYVRLPGLAPNRTYYYKVVSRDAAGNVKEEDNEKALYSFRTLAPLQVPWTDNLDNGAPNWSTYSSPEMGWGSSDVPDWTLGVPANGLETEAHSPPNAWGSNLKGGPMDSAEMFLISPAVYLPEGNSATLRFWHNYEFNDYSGFDLEFGALQISVNNGPLQDLAGYFDYSFGWEEETVDLTPYAGKMVYLVWHYILLGFDYGPRPGWLVDDVSITTASFSPGIVQITNNIWQAEYVLSGPMYRRGRGPVTITNAPPGQYFIEFAPVRYYSAPQDQTRELAPGGVLILGGNYTFADVNNNGMSDEWELEYFNVVDPGRTRSTNTDGDGMSDHAEFVTGTDPTRATNVVGEVPGEVRLNVEVLDGGVTRLTWPSPNGCGYIVESSHNLQDWSVASPWIRATARTTTHTLPGPATERTYYRLRAEP
jgi:hypothetical protein